MTRPLPSFEDLLVALKDPNRHARCRAAQGLGESGDPRAVEPLLGALADPAGDVRAKAVIALGRLRDERAIGPLIEAMRDDKVSVRDGATAAVKKFGKRAYPPLLEAHRQARGPFKRALLKALAHFKTPAVSELLIAALDDPDQTLFLEAINLLGRRKDRRAVERLLEALTEARSELNRALQAWRQADGRTAPTGAQAQAEAAAWAEHSTRLHSLVWALSEIRDARAFTPLQELLESDASQIHPGIVPDIVRALRKIDNPRAVDLLHSLLDDPSYPGRDWLARSLAGMDLMNATQALCSIARGGNFGVLMQALQAAQATQDALHDERTVLEDTTADQETIGGFGTDLMRRLEGVIRELGRGQHKT